MSDPEDAGRGEETQPSEPEGGSPPPALDPSIFEFLLARIEYLSRELGRAEGKQYALDRQIARLEQQLARLEREREREQERGGS